MTSKPSQHQKSKRGRRPKPPEEKRTHRYTLRFDDEENRRILQAAGLDDDDDAHHWMRVMIKRAARERLERRTDGVSKAD